MRSIRCLAALFLCCLVVVFPALAVSTAPEVSGSAAVAADGSCLVELTVTVQLDSPREGLTFPLPLEAEEVLLNGQPAQTHKSDGKLLVMLPSLSAGRQTLLLRYNLPCVIVMDEEESLLSLPMLSGFSLRIERLQFAVSLPGAITGRPVFHSGYHQENIRLNTDISENTLVASTNQVLQDHETLRLELSVEPEQFSLARPSLLSRWDMAMLVLIALALTYYALTLKPKFYRHSRSCIAPEGITAGEVGCCLTGSGTDLSMMVLSWAQLGYLQVELDKRGHLLLHKQMAMGNERSYHEGRIFQILFGRRDTVDAASTHFTRIHRKVAGRSPLLKQLYKPNSGDVRIFQALCCAAGLCSGVQLASGFPAFLLGVLALVLSFGIQSGCRCIPLRSKLPLLVAIGCGCVWILLGNWLDGLGRAICMVIFQFAVGILSAYGGKRSEQGQQVLSQLMGLRQHMLSGSNFDLQKLQQKNPNYFYEMIPYALAMGIDRKFAKRFDNKTPLPECLWLVGAPRMNAQQCAARLRHIADVLDQARYRKI